MATQPMTPSITAGQIGKLQELLGAALRKSDLPSDGVQHVIEVQGDILVAEVIAALRTRVEAQAGMIVRCVRPNRLRDPQAVLVATGGKLFTTQSVVDTMPRGEGDEVEVVLFQLKRWISDDDLEKKEYAKRGLVPADPYSLAAVNQADPAFAHEHPNATHWKDKDGKWCNAAFYRWLDERIVYVGRDDYQWVDRWWFAGLRK